MFYYAGAEQKMAPCYSTSDDSHDEWMGNGGLDMERLFVQGFELLVVLLCRVHLDFQSVNFQQLGALLQVFLAFFRLKLLTFSLSFPRLRLYHSPGRNFEVASEFS